MKHHQELSDTFRIGPPHFVFLLCVCVYFLEVFMCHGGCSVVTTLDILGCIYLEAVNACVAVDNIVTFLTQELKWSLSPQTPISWLNVYMQVAYLKETEDLLIPRYPQTTFSQISEVCVRLV